MKNCETCGIETKFIAVEGYTIEEWSFCLECGEEADE